MMEINKSYNDLESSFYNSLIIMRVIECHQINSPWFQDFEEFTSSRNFSSAKEWMTALNEFQVYWVSKELQKKVEIEFDLTDFIHLNHYWGYIELESFSHNGISLKELLGENIYSKLLKTASKLKIKVSLESNLTFSFQNFKRNKSVSMNELFNGHGLTSTLYEVEEFMNNFGEKINPVFPKEETQMNWSCSCDYASKDVVKASFDQNQFEWSQDWGFDEEPIITPEWYREIDVAGIPTVIIFTIKPTEYDELDTRHYEFTLKTIGLTAEELKLVTSSFVEAFNSTYKLSEMEVYSSTEIILGSITNH